MGVQLLSSYCSQRELRIRFKGVQTIQVRETKTYKILDSPNNNVTYRLQIEVRQIYLF